MGATILSKPWLNSNENEFKPRAKYSKFTVTINNLRLQRDIKV